jgi:hypothetical protein
MCVTNLHAGILKRCAVVTASLLLCACANVPSFLSGGDAARANAAAPYASTAPIDPMQTRMTRHDIMLEWGTLVDDRRVPEEPDYALTIEQIMANATCNACDERPYHRMVVNASNRYGVSVGLIHAVIQKESSYNPSARSKRRARGLMQVTPATARFVGIKNSKRLYDPQTNIYAGTAYLKYLLANHATVDEALAAYNSGPGNVRKYKGVPPFVETKRYVRDVKRLYAVTSR